MLKIRNNLTTQNKEITKLENKLKKYKNNFNLDLKLFINEAKKCNHINNNNTSSVNDYICDICGYNFKEKKYEFEFKHTN